jgi:hypothetical protein
MEPGSPGRVVHYTPHWLKINIMYLQFIYERCQLRAGGGDAVA